MIAVVGVVSSEKLASMRAWFETRTHNHNPRRDEIQYNNIAYDGASFGY